MKTTRILLTVSVLAMFVVSLSPSSAMLSSGLSGVSVLERLQNTEKNTLNLLKGTMFVQDEIIVKFKGDTEQFRVIKVPKGKVGGKIKEYLQRKDVVYAEPNYVVSIQVTPNDPAFSNLWGLHNTGQTGGTPDADIDAPEAWDIQKGTSTVVIAVIDTGVDYNHSDLAANIWTNPGEIPGNGKDDDGNGFIDDVRGWDFYNNDNNPFDDNGHGTHCAGTIGAVGNNGVGVVGVNWNVKILPLKFLGADGGGYTDDAVLAINYATQMGAHIMSNSWGGGGYSQTLKDAIDAANTAGILFVAAAGNNGKNNDTTPMYPASYDSANIVAVAATDHNDQKASFSSYGAVSVDLGAPGVDIYSTVPANSYASYSGTSMATPHVSGVAGLIKAQFLSFKSNEIKSRLLSGVDPVSSLAGKTLTGGRLNAANSLETDNVPPSAVTDLAAINPTINSVTLTWTATGDDGNVGTANSYDIRYSTSPIDDTNWNGATQAVGEPKPKAAGSAETFKVTGLASNTTYYFALKVLDNIGNVSGLSNVVSETTKAPTIIFKDDMESGQNGWTHGGDYDNWQLGTPTSGPGYAHSGSNVWATNLAGNYGNNYMNAQLASPSINLSEIKSSQLEFQHYYYAETNYDGGIVEVSTNGGSSWTQITPVGGYPLTLKSGFGNPLGPVPAYSGYSGPGWHKAVFDISAYDGSNNLKIRFRFGTDSSVNNYPGWYIDDVIVLGELLAPNPPPVANDQYVATNEDTPLIITLTGSDPDGDPITFKIATNPANGTLTLDADFSTTGRLVYIPNLNFYGPDSFTFVVNDGKVDSSPATVSISVDSVNDAPVAYDQAVETTVDIAVPITLKASDVDGNPLSYSIGSYPAHGTLAGSAPNLIYTPTTNYTGGDSFTFKANDGTADSNIATVSITIKSLAVKCWSGSNKYLYQNANQAKKFCKCAQGTYGYKTYKTIWATKKVWQYTDTANNENWTVASLSSWRPITSVTCTDSKAYSTNQDYYYPK